MNKGQPKKIILSTHYLIYSASQALRDYIAKYTPHTLLYISHPLPGVNPDKRETSYSGIFVKSKKSIIRKAAFRFDFLPITLILEFLLLLKWSFSVRENFDLYIGVDNFNALNGLILKKLGKVNRVVYYTIDYFPTRFENKILNNIYHAIDKFCVKHADETWNVSEQMVTARKKFNNMTGKEFRRQFTVPIGIWFDSAPRKPFTKIQKYKLIFVGHLVAHMGVDLVLRSMPLILKQLPQVKLEIIGGGEELENLRKICKDLGLDKHVTFWGWIRDRKKLENIISSGAIGLAPFNTHILDEKVKNADPGKIKDYMLLGLPVILTNAVRTAGVIEKHRCGVVIDYNEKELAQAVFKILKNDESLKQYRDNAIAYIQQFDYAKIFKPNLDRMLKIQ